MRISDWSSDVCSSDLPDPLVGKPGQATAQPITPFFSGLCYIDNCRRERKAADAAGCSQIGVDPGADDIAHPQPDLVLAILADVKTVGRFYRAVRGQCEFGGSARHLGQVGPVAKTIKGFDAFKFGKSDEHRVGTEWVSTGK